MRPIMGMKCLSASSVAIRCDKPIYVSGDQVIGYVVLSVAEALAARSVVVRVDGYEETSWIQVNDNDDIPRSEHEDRRPFLTGAATLWDSDTARQIASGQYQFGFRFTLPVDIPGSYCFTRNRGCKDTRSHDCGDAKGHIKYQITAFVMTAESDTTSILKGELEMFVRQKLSRRPSEIATEATTPMQLSCLRSGGDVIVRIRAEKDVYMAGEFACIQLELDNRAQVAIAEARVSLEQLVTLRVRGGSKGQSICQSVTKIFTHTFPGVPKGVSCTGPNALRLNIPLWANCNLLPATAVGRLVTCSYRICVELSPGAGANPRLTVPLTIYTAPPPPSSHEPHKRLPATVPTVDVPLDTTRRSLSQGRDVRKLSVLEMISRPF